LKSFSRKSRKASKGRTTSDFNGSLRALEEKDAAGGPGFDSVQEGMVLHSLSDAETQSNQIGGAEMGRRKNKQHSLLACGEDRPAEEALQEIHHYYFQERETG